LGFLNVELRFWLGWAQEVAGDHAAAQESWKQARSELEPFLRQQPENWVLIGDLALTNMGLGDKTAAFAFVEKAIAVNPIEKDPMDGLVQSRSLPACPRKWARPSELWALCRNCSRHRTKARLTPQTYRLLLRCSGSIRCSTRSGMMGASKNSSPRPCRTIRSNDVHEFMILK